MSLFPLTKIGNFQNRVKLCWTANSFFFSALDFRSHSFQTYFRYAVIKTNNGGEAIQGTQTLLIKYNVDWRQFLNYG